MNELNLKKRILYFKKKAIGECYQEVDGYYIYYPSIIGFLDEHLLRLIADFLKDLNKDWDIYIKKNLSDN